MITRCAFIKSGLVLQLVTQPLLAQAVFRRDGVALRGMILWPISPMAPPPKVRQTSPRTGTTPHGILHQQPTARNF